jgi:predicted  nucleic acid-binding Zn-ribbon protein
MLPSLTALIALQSLDSAAEASRRRLAELPKAEESINASIAAATSDVDAAHGRLQEAQTARRALEKDVAAVDARLSRFDDHKAVVKTNQEYTALLHEIATAKSEKDALEERILVLMEDADRLAADLKAAGSRLAQITRDGEQSRATLGSERAALDAELSRLAAQRAEQRAKTEPRALAIYEQLLKGRRGVAVAQMVGETCMACHVRLRPHVTQLIRRNEEIVQCESCQRILYYEPPPAQSAGAAAPQA